MPKVSVIVPVYNAKDYLRRCVDSILAQSLADFELLLVNDGSTDTSGEICDHYSNIDSRVRVFHKDNGGVSSARNTGLKNASGEWLCFVDSDDAVHPDYLNNLVSATDKNVELVISFSISVFIDKIVEPTYCDAILTRKDFAKLFNEYDLHWRTSPWAKLYQSKIIKNNNLLFNSEMPIGEDLVFLYDYISFVDCIFVSRKAYYYYYAEVQSSLTKKVNPISVEYGCMITVLSVIDALIDKKSIRDTDALAKLEYTKYTYINRTLNAIYHNSCSVRERINWLNRIHFSPYLNYLACHMKTVREFLSYFLIKYRMLVLYDFIRIFNGWFNIGRLK